ncbi:MAG: hypothetical protein HKN87_21075 [Saprospiraceae bacterium]|nr:hypothetical protein [Saprospiraceae bacterium]
MKNQINIIFLVLGLTSFFCLDMHAQIFQKGDIVAHAGIGLGSTYSFGGLGLPLGGGVEFGVTDNIGVGGDVGFVSASGLTIFYIGPKGYYHFNDLLNLDSEELDVYGGISILYRNFSVGDGIFGVTASGIYPGFHVGGRYFFSENLGAYAELGNSYGWLKVGVCLKL